MKEISTAFVHVFAMMAPWLVFVFLMVGPAMNAMSLTTVSALFGRKAAAAYVTVIIVGAVLCGIAINLVPGAASASMPGTAAGHALSPVHWSCAAFLAAMMSYNLVRPVRMGARGGQQPERAATKCEVNP